MDLKKHAQQYARDRGSCDDEWIGYLEHLEECEDADRMLAQMLAG
jgi:hypothetical protein